VVPEGAQVTDFDQRTPGGALLRSALDKVTIPPGRKGQAVLVATKDGAELGAAWLTPRGWTIEANVRAAVRDGRARDVAVTLGVTW